MTADLWAGGLGALWFFLLALLLGAGGVGLLALTGCRERLTAPLFLAPAVMLAAWTVLSSAAAWLRFPIAAVAPWLWGVTLLLAAWGGLVLVRTARVPRTASAPGAGRRIDAAWLVPTMLAFLLPLAVMPGVLCFGLEDFAGSNHLDSWSYIAFADYLLREVRGAEGGLSPLHQYASHLANVRNAADALLAFLSTAAPGGRPDTAVNLFCLLSLFAFAGAVVHFGITMFGRRWAPVTALLLLSVYGWPGDIIFYGNFDQLLVLPLFPALAAVAAHIAKRRSFWRLTLLSALLIAAAFYAYVEVAALGVAAAASFLLPKSGRVWPALGRAAASAGLALAGAGAALLPAATMLPPYFLQQLAVGTGTGVRPGESYFPGLIDPSYALSALWALGGEFRIDADYSARGLTAALLAGCALWGAARERRRWLAVLAAAATVGFAGVMAFRSHYAYGAYKILSINFWLLAWLAVTGCAALPGRWGRRPAYADRLPPVLVGLALVVAPAIYFRADSQIALNDFAGTAKVSHLSREAGEAAARIVGDSAVLMSVTDTLANEWAVYQLSALPLRVVPYRAYMAEPWVRPRMAAARPVPWHKIAFVLTDRSRPAMPAEVTGGHIVWENPLYALWQVAPGGWLTLVDVRNPNGLEIINGRPSLWLGGGTTRFTLVSGAAQEAVLSAELAPGPRASPDARSWQLAITAGDWRTEIGVSPPVANIRLPLQTGETEVSLDVLAAPAGPVPPNGDPRAMILGFIDYRLEPASR